MKQLPPEKVTRREVVAIIREVIEQEWPEKYRPQRRLLRAKRLQHSGVRARVRRGGIPT